MFSAQIKTIMMLAVVAILSSCNSNDNKQEASAAEALYNEAMTYFNNSEFNRSLEALDSLKARYPKQIEIQKKGMHLRAQNTERIIVNELVTTSELLNEAQAEVNSLKDNFSTVKDKYMVEGYTVHKKAKNNPLLNRTGIEMRIDERDSLYIVSLVNGKNLNHTRISAIAGEAHCATKDVPYDGSKNYSFKDGSVSNEMVTFRMPEVDSIGNFIINHYNLPIKIEFTGTRSYSMPLTVDQKKILAETARYSKALRNLKKYDMQKRYLDNKLQIAKSHIDKTKPTND